MSNGDGLGRAVTGALGYLLKHAHLRLEAATAQALQPFGIDPRALGVLRVLASREPTSQQEVAQLLSVDRTTMVALLDALEGQGIVARRPQTADRRRNVVELTKSGRQVFQQAQKAAEEAEQHFLGPLDQPAAQQMREALHVVVTAEREQSTGGMPR